jgi:hypothetical protein
MRSRLIANVERGIPEASTNGKIITSWNLTITEDNGTKVETIRHNDLITLYAGPYIYHQPDPDRPLVFTPSAHGDMSRLMFAGYYVLIELSVTLTGDYFLSYYIDGKMVEIKFIRGEARQWLTVNHTKIVFVLKNYPEGFDYNTYSVY